MYTDENTDKDDFDDLSPEDSPNVTRKSLSTVGFRSATENQNARPMALRATQSFTGAVEELRFCSNFERMELSRRGIETKTTPVCPCGCRLRPARAAAFRTRERDTLALHVVAPAALLHHGHQHEPQQIAMFWKKDCRMFLWKGKSKIKTMNTDK